MKKTTHKTSRIDRLLIVGALFLFYVPVIFSRFAYCDDAKPELDKIFFSAGRPVSAVLYQTFQQPITLTAQFGWLRFVSFIGAALLAITIHQLARSIIADRFNRIALAISIAILPASIEYVAWATCWLFHFSATLAILAAILTWRATIVLRKKRATAILLVGGSYALMLITIFIYQASLSWFWVAGLILLLHPRLLSQKFRQRATAWFYALGFAQFIACFAAYKLYSSLYGSTDSRAAFVSDVPDKAYHFLRIQIPTASGLWHLMNHDQLPVTIAISTIVLAAIAIGSILHLKRNGKSVAWRIFWIAAVAETILLTHAHWLLINSNMELYRIMGSFTAAFAILFFWSTQLSRDKFLRFVPKAVIVIAVLASAYNLHHYWVEPRVAAHRFLVEQLKANVSTETKHIHVIEQRAGDGIIEERVAEAFYGPYTALTDTPNLIRFALNDIKAANGSFPDIGEIEITSGPASETFVQNQNTIVIDARKLAAVVSTDE